MLRFWGVQQSAVPAVLPKTGLLLRILIEVTMIRIYGKSYGIWMLVIHIKFLNSNPEE